MEREAARDRAHPGQGRDPTTVRRRRAGRPLVLPARSPSSWRFVRPSPSDPVGLAAYVHSSPVARADRPPVGHHGRDATTTTRTVASVMTYDVRTTPTSTVASESPDRFRREVHRIPRRRRAKAIRPAGASSKATAPTADSSLVDGRTGRRSWSPGQTITAPRSPPNCPKVTDTCTSPVSKSRWCDDDRWLDDLQVV